MVATHIKTNRVSMSYIESLFFGCVFKILFQTHNFSGNV
ncbi:hypothetical protein M23134_06212 [Microscilla marina ATCC 23134]|uniref:Uncharacterized protein n=1 Tax=Microscilla marina ATCC 23134 TaxID=313606 RepID=A1ZVT7_MICM2|nr:hypothetical protein M23134_06212 [Microscilla marina ATCC 23134]